MTRIRSKPLARVKTVLIIPGRRLRPASCIQLHCQKCARHGNFFANLDSDQSDNGTAKDDMPAICVDYTQSASIYLIKHGEWRYICHAVHTYIWYNDLSNGRDRVETFAGLTNFFCCCCCFECAAIVVQSHLLIESLRSPRHQVVVLHIAYLAIILRAHIVQMCKKFGLRIR